MMSIPRFTKLKLHGTRNAYRNGCRCGECSKAESDYRAKLYARRNGKPEPKKAQRTHVFVDPHALEVGEITVICNAAKARKLCEVFGWEEFS